MTATDRLTGLIDEVLKNYLTLRYWRRDGEICERSAIARKIAEHIEANQTRLPEPSIAGLKIFSLEDDMRTAVRAFPHQYPVGTQLYAVDTDTHWMAMAVGVIEHFPAVDQAIRDASGNPADYINIVQPEENPMPEYTPQVGDTVHLPTGRPDDPFGPDVEVVHIHDDKFWGLSRGHHSLYDMNPTRGRRWEKVPTYPEVWIAVDRGGSIRTAGVASSKPANLAADGYTHIIHMAADGSVERIDL